MIHRQYVVKMTPSIQGFLPLDIAVRIPGARTAPVADQAAYAGSVVTQAPAAWVAACCTGGWYYEIRGRAVRVENLAGTAGFTPRLRLGARVSVVALQDANNQALISGSVPPFTFSASLAPDPIAQPLMGTEIVGVLADPTYGPVIRLQNGVFLVGQGQGQHAAYFLVSLGIAENKDEDWANLGHA